MSFGGEALLYQKLDPAEGDADAFAAAAAGRYGSDDADATATIAGTGGDVSLVLTDGHGKVKARLSVLSPTVAYTKAGGAMAAFRLTLSLGDDGFTVSTPRTRNLVFRRV